MDKRIKAVATASMYDISRTARYGFGDTVDAEAFDNVLDQLAEQRWKDVDNGYHEYNPAFPKEPTETVPEGLDPISEEFYRYYGTPRGHHPNALGGFTTTSDMAMSNFSSLDHIETISPRPILFIIGDKAHSRYFSEDAYEAASEPKELYVVPNSEHIDLYDDVNKIPFDKMESFFKEAFKAQN